MLGLHRQARISSLSDNKVNLPEKTMQCGSRLLIALLALGDVHADRMAFQESRRMVRQCVVRLCLFTNVTDNSVHSCSPGNKERGKRSIVGGRGRQSTWRSEENAQFAFTTGLLDRYSSPIVAMATFFSLCQQASVLGGGGGGMDDVATSR